jgi:hypothetical protein
MSLISWHGKLGATEASTLGWKPGQWPNIVQVDGLTLTRNVGMTKDTGQGAVWYDVKGSDLQVLVFND